VSPSLFPRCPSSTCKGTTLGSLGWCIVRAVCCKVCYGSFYMHCRNVHCITVTLSYNQSLHMPYDLTKIFRNLFYINNNCHVLTSTTDCDVDETIADTLYQLWPKLISSPLTSNTGLSDLEDAKQYHLHTFTCELKWIMWSAFNFALQNEVAPRWRCR